MNEVFLRYLDPAFGCEGLTGVALAHLVTRDLFGYTLPAWYQSLELVRDLAHFEAVPDEERMQAGDLVWLGADRPLASLEEFVPRYRGHEPPNGPDFPATHVAICTGARQAGITYCCTPAPWTAPAHCGRSASSVTTPAAAGSTRSGGYGRSSGTPETRQCVPGSLRQCLVPSR